MDASSNVQSIVKEPVVFLVRCGWSSYLAQVTVTVAWHKCTVFYGVSIARNTLAISTQCIIVWTVITPEQNRSIVMYIHTDAHAHVHTYM